MLTIALLAITAIATPSLRTVVRDSVRPIPVILEIRIGAIAAATVPAMRRGETALLPVARVLSLAELRSMHELSEYMSTDSLSSLLYSAITVDWDGLTASITDDGKLPVSRRLAREQRRYLFNDRDHPSVEKFATVRTTPAFPRTLVVDYDLATSFDIAAVNAHIALGSNALGGALNVDWARTVLQPLGRSTISWERGWPDRAGIRHIRVGTNSNGRSSFVGAGVFFSTELPAHGDSIDPIHLAGKLGAGWDVEVYRDDIMIYTGVVDSTGAYAVTAPVSRGSNRLTVSAHGPYDERRLISRYVSIDNDMIPTGTGAYDLAIGRCEAERCEYAAEAVARFAPFARLTVGTRIVANVDSSKLAIQRAIFVAARVRDDINTSARYSRAAASADIRYSPVPAFDLLASYQSSSRAALANSSMTRRSTVVVNTIWRWRSGRSVTVNLDLSGPDLADEQRLRIGSSLLAGAVHVRPFATAVRQRTTRAATVGYGTLVELSIPLLLPAGNTLRGGIGSNPFVALSIPFARVARIETSAEWLGGAHSPLLSMAVSIPMRATTYQGRSVATGSHALTTHALSGSIVLTGGGSAGNRLVMLSSTPSRGRAEISGKVFLDKNANGVCDSTDQLLPGVAILFGATTIETDSAGEYHLVDMTAFSSVLLSVDSLTLPYPGMEVQPVRVTTMPNGVTRVDLPVTRRRSTATLLSISSISRLAEDAQSCDAPAVHRDYLKPSVRDPNPITHAREPTQAREHIASEC